MKICVSTYSFGAYSKKGFTFMADKAKELGFDGIEIVEGSFEGSGDLAFAAECAKYCDSIGLEIASLCTGADLLKGDTAIAAAKRSVDLCHAYGAKIMRHDVAYGSPHGFFKVVGTLAEACGKISDYAKEKGVVTCTENHGFFSQDSARVEALINETANENFGALIDIGNFLCADEEPTLAVGNLAKYAKHVHAKDFYVRSGMDIDPGEGFFRSRAGNYLKGAVIGHGNAHAAQSLGILKRAGYDGWISVEFEGAEDNLTGIRQGLANVKRFWGMY